MIFMVTPARRRSLATTYAVLRRILVRIITWATEVEEFHTSAKFAGVGMRGARSTPRTRVDISARPHARPQVLRRRNVERCSLSRLTSSAPHVAQVTRRGDATLSSVVRRAQVCQKETGLTPVDRAWYVTGIQ